LAPREGPTQKLPGRRQHPSLSQRPLRKLHRSEQQPQVGASQQVRPEGSQAGHRWWLWRAWVSQETQQQGPGLYAPPILAVNRGMADEVTDKHLQ
jgi:hypothetical protein